ncbi:hypothetical protein QCA50_005970 [Cerrena zonata]|uniref:Uncharacterized protein n=1 Tax=Cerrena zonata TaxID=2478898 RepID=A0AAW0GBQ0_9APHY
MFNNNRTVPYGHLSSLNFVSQTHKLAPTSPSSHIHMYLFISLHLCSCNTPHPTDTQTFSFLHACVIVILISHDRLSPHISPTILSSRQSIPSFICFLYIPLFTYLIIIAL